MATKKITPNRYKVEETKQDKALMRIKRKALFGKFFLILFVSVMSVSCIYMHDAVLQCPLFDVKTIMIDGLDRVNRNEVLALTGLDQPANIFELRPDILEKQLNAHPWVQTAMVKRRLLSTVAISIQEQKPLAIVSIENLTDIVINTQGAPFKEYEPAKDQLDTLPVISGVDLSLSNNTYLFEGDLFNAVLDLLKIKSIGQIHGIFGDENTGLLINILNTAPDAGLISNPDKETHMTDTYIPVKLGFDRFKEKLARAGQIQRYMTENHPDKTICAMDLFDLEKVFVKTKNAAHNITKKGV